MFFPEFIGETILFLVSYNNYILSCFFLSSLGRPFCFLFRTIIIFFLVFSRVHWGDHFVWIFAFMYNQYGALVQNILFFRFDSQAKMSWEYMNIGPGNPGNVMGFCFPKDLSTRGVLHHNCVLVRLQWNRSHIKHLDQWNRSSH